MKRLVFLGLVFIAQGFMVVTAQQTEKNAPAKQPENEVQPQLIRGPYLQVATTHSILVRWRTDVLSRGRVKFGTAPGELTGMVDDSTLSTEHAVKIDGLQPNSKYYYSVGQVNVTMIGDNDTYFYTLPQAGQTGFYRVGIFGDCGNNSVNQRIVKQAAIKYLDTSYMNAWILLGDNAYSDGSDAQFQAKFFNIYKDDLLKKYPLFPAPGNHDYRDIEFTAKMAQKTHDIAYYQNFSMPAEGESGGVPSHTKSYYSFDIGNIHFLSLDSYGKDIGDLSMYDTLSPQVEWIKKDLEANTNKEWVVAYWHHPPYTMGSHSSDREGDLVKIRENFIRVLERYNVDLILCGHSHDYERSALMAGHYGNEASFNAATHNINSSTGRYDGSANSSPYIKNKANGKGTVYVVSGSAGQLGGKQPEFPHNAMVYSNADIGGSSMIEVNGNRLDYKWICSDGVIRDHFTMMKDVNKTTQINIKKGETAHLTASFVGEKYVWNKSKETGREIAVTPSVGKTTYEVKDERGVLKDVFNVRVSQ